MLLYSTMLFALLQAAVTVPFRNPGTDFTPVWTAARKYLAGEPVFDSDYTVDMPHYLYTPAGTVVIAPIGIFDDQSTGRLVMLALGTLCIIAALALATWMVTTRHFHHVFPLIVTVVFLTPEPVRTTLWLTNINGFLLLLMVVFVWCSLRLRGAGWNEHLTRPEAYVAGITAGVAISVKPQFGVLLIISVLLLQAAVVLIAESPAPPSSPSVGSPLRSRSYSSPTWFLICRSRAPASTAPSLAWASCSAGRSG